MKETETVSAVPAWMPIFLSLMLVLLTLFIFLSTFTESDPEKVKIFKAGFRKNFIFEGKGISSKVSFVEQHNSDPLVNILNRIKKEKLNVELMQDYLKISEIKTLGVKEVARGLSLIVDFEQVFQSTDRISADAEKKLLNLSYLVTDLPYLIEINAFSGDDLLFREGMNAAFRRVKAVYNFFLSAGVHPLKMKIACRLASADRLNALEIIFKEPEL